LLRLQDSVIFKGKLGHGGLVSLEEPSKPCSSLFVNY
jgi:hypothetical protein